MAADAQGLTADRGNLRAAVLGSPIAHSLSPALHAAAYAALGLAGWSYQAIECDAAGLHAFLDGCGPDWAGLSLTMPLKRTVLPLLHRAEPLVTQVGAANTVIFEAGRRAGYNTDVAGMARALTARGIGAGSAPGPALILGGGATACSALATLRDLGERSATVAVRDPARTTDLRAAASRLDMSVTLAPFDPSDVRPDVRLIISTAPAGAADIYREIYSAPVADPPALLDVVYHPWPTVLAAAASRAGAIVASGLDLLLYQAAAQVQLMTGRPAPVDAMRAAGLAELTARPAAARASASAR